MSKLATPAVLSAATDHGASTYRLTLVRTFFSDEGSCLLERLTGDVLDFVENGSWAVRRSDEGPAALHVDLDDSGDVADMPLVVNLLLGELVLAGASWGIEACEVWS